MEPTFIKQTKRPPSSTFRKFAEPYGLAVTGYDRFGELTLFPSLIAARGRARSFERYKNQHGSMFNEAECHYVNGQETDAFAARRDDKFCILVYDAVGFQMLDLFSFAFACPDFFKEIGDPSLESIDRGKARTKPAGYGFFRNGASDAIDVQKDLAHPLCPIREQAALYFTGLAMDGIWTHELAHAFMGHLDYAEIELGVRAMGETPDGNGDLRQMPLEAEADRFASATLVQSGFGPSPYLPKSLYELDTNIRVRAGFVVSAMLTWFWAFQQRIERKFDDHDPYTQGTHPPPLARLHLSFDGAREMLQNLRWQPAQIQTVTFDAMAEMEALAEAKDWFSILHPKRSFSKDALAFSKDIKLILGEAFKSIHSGLEPHRYYKQ